MRVPRILPFLVFAIAVSASPILEIGPIGLNGSGWLTNPDWSSWGGDGWGGEGFGFSATGSNGSDTVSINVRGVEIPGDSGLRTVFSADVGQCSILGHDICTANIDGISGYGAFSNIGGGQGLLQVYAINQGAFFLPGALLAEAIITNTEIHITDVTYGTHLGLVSFFANFTIVDPPSSVPEPGTWLAGIPLLFGLSFGAVRAILNRRSEERWPLSACILKCFARSIEAPGGTELHVGDHALDFILDTVPGFLDTIKGKSVLDYGCGHGDQAIAMKHAGAARVVAYDPFPKFPADHQGVEFTDQAPRERFDIVLNCSAFEHFSHPALEFDRMRDRTAGKLIITWAEPWFSNNGSHMGNFVQLPWVNLLFPERAVFLVRSLYRDDGATSYATAGLGGAVNKMTVRRFERIVKDSGMRIEYLHHTATRKLPLVTHVPVLRELLTSACTAILTEQPRP